MPKPVATWKVDPVIRIGRLSLGPPEPTDAAGGELPGVVKQVHDQVVEVDFNHPLAGKVITFDVEIVDVR